MRSSSIPYILSAYKNAGCQHDSSRIVFYRYSYSEITYYSYELSQMIFVYDYMSELVSYPFSTLITQFSNNMLTGDEKSYHGYLFVDLLMLMYEKCYTKLSVKSGDVCGGDILRLALYNHSFTTIMGDYEVLSNNLLKIPMSIGIMTDYKTLYSVTSMEVSPSDIDYYFGRQIVYYDLPLAYKIIYYIIITFVSIINILSVILLIINRRQSIIKKSSLSYCIFTLVASECSIFTGLVNSISPHMFYAVCYFREILHLLNYCMIYTLFETKVYWFLSINATGLKSVYYYYIITIVTICN